VFDAFDYRSKRVLATMGANVASRSSGHPFLLKRLSVRCMEVLPSSHRTLATLRMTL
jgi:hypothetical protein